MKPLNLMITVVFLLVLFLVPLEYSHAGKTTCDFQHRECFTEAGFPACYKKIDIEKYYQFVSEGKLDMAEQIVSDDKKCIKLSGNKKAFLQDTRGAYSKFGIRGRDVTFWAKREALFTR